MYELPTEIKIGNDIFHIRGRGDFRVILDCFLALQDVELQPEYRTFTALYIFYEDFDSIEQLYLYPEIESLASEMFNFFTCNEPVVSSKKKSLQLIDWNLDSQMICSAVNKVAGKEIRLEPYVHWWTFLGYYNAVGSGLLSTVISIRKKVTDGEKLSKDERKFKLENPQYFNRDFRTVDQRAEEEEFRKLWNKS